MTAKTDLQRYVRWLAQTLHDYPGAVVQVRSSGMFGRLIRRVLKGYSNHTAIARLTSSGVDIGDAEPKRAKWTPLAEYVRRISAGDCIMRVCVPTDYTRELGATAAERWGVFVEGRYYDAGAIVWLWVKLRLKLAKVLRQWEWAWFCTEGVTMAWTFSERPPVFGKQAHESTPQTVENRIADGGLIELLPEWADSTEQWQQWLLRLQADINKRGGQ
jgi:hypothetical protein